MPLSLSLLLVAGALLAFAAALLAGARVPWALAGSALVFAALSGSPGSLALAGERTLAALRTPEWQLVPVLCWLAALLDETGARGLARGLPGAVAIALVAHVLALPWLDLLLASAVPLLCLAAANAAFAWWTRGPREVFAAKLAPIAVLGVALAVVSAGLLESSEAGALAALAVAALSAGRGQLGWAGVQRASRRALVAAGGVAAVLLGATAFQQVLRDAGFGTLADAALALAGLPAPWLGAGVLGVVLALGNVLRAEELALAVVPLAAPLALAVGTDRLWLAAALVVSLQASRLAPLGELYAPAPGRRPPALRLAFPSLALAAMFVWPELALWLPQAILS